MQKRLISAAIFAAILVIAAVILASVLSSPATDQAVDTATEDTDSAVTWCIFSNADEKECFDEVALQQGDTAFTTFQRLDEREEDLIFESTDYGPELGHFVTSINDIPGDSERFWKLYVNGAESQMGVSQVAAAAGDNYDFRLEAVIY